VLVLAESVPQIGVGFRDTAFPPAASS